MKINGRKSHQIAPMGPFGIPAAPAGEPAQEVHAGDQVELSSTQQVRQLNQMAQALPEVRLEKVSDLRDAIEDGSYYVESEKLARKVVDEALTESLLQHLENRR